MNRHISIRDGHNDEVLSFKELGTKEELNCIGNRGSERQKIIGTPIFGREEPGEETLIFTYPLFFTLLTKNYSPNQVPVI